MPKIQIDFASGTRMDEEWHGFITQRFGEQMLRRLERLGGRLTLSLTVPRVSDKHANPSPPVNESEIETLRSLSADLPALRERLNTYDVRSLREACGLLGLIVSKKTPRVQLVAEIVRQLESGRMWKIISQS